MNSTVRTVLFWVMMIVLAALLWQMASKGRPTAREDEPNYSNFLAKVESGNVKDAGGVMSDRELEGQAAIVWALSSDAEQAQKLADDLNKRFPEATYVRFGSLPAVRGILAIRRGNMREGIENLPTISSHALIYPINQVTPPMVPVYVSGEAYLAAHRGAEAAAAFQLIVDNPGLVWNGPIGALAHLGLGRAYTMQNDTAKARAAYQDFFALWKDADPDIPIFKQAEAEYATLE